MPSFHKSRLMIILFPLLALSSTAFAAASQGGHESISTTKRVEASVASDQALHSVLSFKEWKTKKLGEAKVRFNGLETRYLEKKKANPRDKQLKALYGDLRSVKNQIDEIDELTVSDYFVGYLSLFKDQKQAFKLAAQRLDSAEVADLMEAYADSLLKTTGEGLSTFQPSTLGEASK